MKSLIVLYSYHHHNTEKIATSIAETLNPGWNTNKVLKVIGGINKGRPNAEDLKRAEAFAQSLKQNSQEA